MNTKHYLMISGIVGGVIGSLLTALLVSPVTAQRDKFGHIECTGLTVIDEGGKPRVVLSGGAWDSSTPFGSEDLKHAGVFIGRAGLYSGVVDVYGDWSHPMGVLQEIANQYPELVDEGVKPLLNSEGMGYNGTVRLAVDQLGGFVKAWTFDKDGKPGAKAELTTTEHGGNVSVWSAKGTVLIPGELGVNEHGGYVHVQGTRERGKVKMGINEYGNGAVSTWDKNGYRQKSGD